MNSSSRSDTEDSQHTHAEHTEPGNTDESSVEESDKQNRLESNIDLKNNSSSSNIENELEEPKETTEGTELRKDRIVCRGDASASQVTDIPEDSESKGKSHRKSQLLSTQEAEAGGSKFEASLVYRANSNSQG